MSFEGTALLLAWLAIVLLALAVSGLIRQVRLLSSRAPAIQLAPMVGMTAPQLNGAPAWTSPTVLLFVDANCAVCDARLVDLGALAEQANGDVSFGAVFPGVSNPLRSERVRVFENQRVAFDELQIPVSPFGVVVAPGGKISHAQPVGSSSSLHELVERARDER